MKTSTLISAIIVCALSTPIVVAQEKSTVAKPAMGMDMNKQMPQMQENMKKMQQQMERIQATTDPVERQKLMREHTLTMQENMKTMGGMGGPMMMGTDQRGGMPMGGQKGGAMMGGDVKPRQDVMEKRMDMMQMMMEQMMQHAQMTESMPPK